MTKRALVQQLRPGDTLVRYLESGLDYLTIQVIHHTYDKVTLSDGYRQVTYHWGTEVEYIPKDK